MMRLNRSITASVRRLTWGLRHPLTGAMAMANGTVYRMITVGQQQETQTHQSTPPPSSSADTPAYTIEDVGEPEQQIEAPPGSKLSWYIKKRIKGHTKKLTLLTRQVSSCP